MVARFASLFLTLFLALEARATLTEPEIFFPASSSGEEVFRGSFSPDGTVFYFFRKTKTDPEEYRIFRSRLARKPGRSAAAEHERGRVGGTGTVASRRLRGMGRPSPRRDRSSAGRRGRSVMVGKTFGRWSVSRPYERSPAYMDSPGAVACAARIRHPAPGSGISRRTWSHSLAGE